MADKIAVSAEISPATLDALKALVALRGSDANTVLEQAVATEKLLADNVGAGDKLLIQKENNSFSQVLFDHA